MKNHELSGAGDLIVPKRHVNRMTQEKVAFDCGITRIAIGKVETGKSLPSLPLFENIAQALGLDGSEFYKEIEYLGLIDDFFRDRKDE